MSETTKDFHLGDILTIITGKLVSPRHINGVYDILSWMAGESIFTHQIARVMREAAPVLVRAHPQLEIISAPEFPSEASVHKWLAEQVAVFGETLPVPKLAEDEHERIDPLSEAAERIHPDKIITISNPGTRKAADPDGEPGSAADPENG